MKEQLKELREIVTEREAKCLEGMTIPKGTTLHVMKETPDVKEGETIGGFPVRKILVVRVDNGTGHLDLMPETAVYGDDIQEKENEEKEGVRSR